jgi:hypothetical protein
MLVDQGRTAEARALLERAAASARRELPANSPERARYDEALRDL